MTQREDERLRERFQALRAETRGSADTPDFDSMMDEAMRRTGERRGLEVVAGGASKGRSPGRRRLMRASAWTSAALAAAVAGLLIVDRAPSGEEDFERLVATYANELGGTTWSSPTSGLLEVPGSGLMRSVPSIGGPVSPVDPANLPAQRSAPEEDDR